MTARRLTAEKFFAEGFDAQELGDDRHAIELYRLALDYDPIMAEAWLNVGTILFDRQNVRVAEKCYKNALAIDPEYALVHFNLGNLFDELCSFRRATERYLEAIRIDPTCADAHFNLALEYERFGDYRKAIGCFRSYIRYGSNDGRAALAEARREIDWLRKRDLGLVRKPVASKASHLQPRKAARR